MRLPYWLLRLLPMWDYICPRCRREVAKNSHKCPHCGERFPFPLKVPPKCLQSREELERYVHEKIFPKLSARQREYLAQYFTILFQDGFESGNFSAWTGTHQSGASVEITGLGGRRATSYSCYKPVILNSNRYIVAGTGWWNTFDTIKVFQADSNWNEGTYYTSSWQSADFYAKVFPSVFPNYILIFGKSSSGGYIAYFDVSNNTFSSQFVRTDVTYITDLVYVNGYFYIVPAGGSLRNIIFRSTASNLFTPSNWEVINLPSWSPSALEVRIAYFSGYMYVLRTNKAFYYDFLKWNLNDNSFTTIMSEADTTTSTFYIYPYVRSSSNRIVVVIPESEDSTYRIYYSDDGNTFTYAFSEPILSGSGEAHCFAVPYSSYILIHNNNDAQTTGYIVVKTTTGSQIGHRMVGVRSHYTEAHYIIDGDNLVMGGEGPNIAELKVFNPFASVIAHHGSCSLKISGLNAVGDRAWARKALTGYTDLYARCYYRFENLPSASGSWWCLAPIFYATLGERYHVAFPIYSFTNSKWGIRYYAPSGWTNIWETGTSTVAANTWYCLEIHIVSADNGKLELWVDGTLKISQAGIDTNTRTLAGVEVGNPYVEVAESTEITIYIDCVVVADTYIGPEAEIILKQWSQTGITTHVYKRHKTFRLTQTLKVLRSWTLPVPVLLKLWNATLQAIHVSRFPMRVIRLPIVLQLSHSFSGPSRLFSLFERLGLLHEFYAGKPSAKKTKLFLVLGDLAIQLSND